jgi:predicted membrane protein
MASCLADIRNEVTNKIRLINPFDYDIQINQNTVVGEAEKVESQPTTLFTVEDSHEIKNVNPTRRIKLCESK